MNCLKTNESLRAQRTDRWAIAHIARLYPLAFCHLEIDGRIDIPRLKAAITQSCQVVPELLCSFDIKKERWIDRGFTADTAVIEGTHDLGNGWRWDLSSDTQLKISVCHHAKGDSLIFAISHILCDGTGFKQYLYLLADIYNSGTLPAQTKNNRDIRLFLGNIRPKPFPVRIRKADAARRLPFDDSSDYDSTEDGARGYCPRERLSTNELTALRAHVKSLGYTVNDALLAAYARVATRILGTNIVVLPCPTDLRQFFTEEPVLTIANMTGAYILPITVDADDDFATTLRQVHEGLRLQKECRSCFAGIRTLGSLCDMLPPTIAQPIERLVGFVLPISYTNTGVIDDQKLCFEGCVVTDCFVTGTYRYSPGFQLSVSTFRDELSLCSTVLGSNQRRERCYNALQQIKSELLGYRGLLEHGQTR